MCKHLEALIDEAILQFGLDRVARYLRVDLGAEPGHGPEVIKACAARRPRRGRRPPRL